MTVNLLSDDSEPDAPAPYKVHGLPPPAPLMPAFVPPVPALPIPVPPAPVHLPLDPIEIINPARPRLQQQPPLVRAVALESWKMMGFVKEDA